MTLTISLLHVLQGILSSVFVLIGDIETLLNIYNANAWFWYAAAFLALIIMRLTMPHKPRPFKVGMASHIQTHIANLKGFLRFKRSFSSFPL